MIRSYEAGDEVKMILNKYSNYGGLEFMFTDNDYEKFTLEDQAGVKAIIFSSEREEKQYVIFMLMAADVTVNNIKSIKECLLDKRASENAKEVLTYSVDDKVIDRWHEFLGFRYVEVS